MTTENPWTTRGSRLIYENPWIKVREDDVIRPDGKPGIYGVVETRLATGVVALSPENEVFLVGQYRYATEHYSWEIIEGGAEPGESALSTIQRELREEAGLVAKNWTPLGEEVHLSNCISSERMVLFVATDLTEVESEPDGTEILQVRKLPFDEVLTMIDEGEIRDSGTIIALLRLERLMRSGKLSV